MWFLGGDVVYFDLVWLLVCLVVEVDYVIWYGGRVVLMYDKWWDC